MPGLVRCQVCRGGRVASGRRTFSVQNHVIHDESSSSEVLTSEPSLSESEFSALRGQGIRINENAGLRSPPRTQRMQTPFAEATHAILSTDYLELSFAGQGNGCEHTLRHLLHNPHTPKTSHASSRPLHALSLTVPRFALRSEASHAPRTAPNKRVGLVGRWVGAWRCATLGAPSAQPTMGDRAGM